MTNRERRDAQMAYISDDSVFERMQEKTSEIEFYGPF